MDCDIVLVGLNHRTAGVDVRERFALVDFCSRENWALPCDDVIGEAMILSTCNRVELLATGHGDVAGRILERWATARGTDPEELRPYVYIYKNMDAVRHLFSVASSLDSMILGEPQILGQLKSAYRKAAACQIVDADRVDLVAAQRGGGIINQIFDGYDVWAGMIANRSTGSLVSFETGEAVTYGLFNAQQRGTLLVGAGEMAELAATHLLQAGVDEILVANRTFSRGEELARQFNGRALPFESLASHLTEVDIIITSTGSPDPVIRARDIRGVLKARKNRPMFFIDIAVPRDIDPDVNGLDNVYLYDIDDLKEVVEENLATRRDEAQKAAEIVDEEVDIFRQWLCSLDVQPTIVDLIQHGENAAHEEVARTLKRLGHVDDATREAIEVMALALVRKLNHDPIMFLKRGTMSQEGSAPRISLMRRIFNLDQGCTCSARNNGEHE